MRDFEDEVDALYAGGWTPTRCRRPGGTGLRSESAAPEPGRPRAVAGTSAAVVLGLPGSRGSACCSGASRFRVPIVLTPTVRCPLAWWLARRFVIDVPRWLAPSVLLGSVVITLTVPLFTCGEVAHGVSWRSSRPGGWSAPSC